VPDESEVDPENPATYVPLHLEADKVEPWTPGDILLLSTAQAPRYAAVSAIDVAAGETVSRQAVLGGAETVYMSANNLYLAAGEYSAAEPPAIQFQVGATESSDSVGGTAGRNIQGSRTRLARIELAGGELRPAAQTSLVGTLLNQFSLDEYGGYLRLVTTWQVAETWANHVGLAVLDGSLELVGSVPSLVEGESVTSVRFASEVGYVVTFRQVDPLFAVDLADPAAPKVLSALKIPGFSSYLHPWGDGRLVGVGVDADESGWQDGLKLALFDTADLYAVAELASQHIDAAYSPALGDHRSVWADVERGLIGFPLEVWGVAYTESYRYVVYSVDDAGTFRERAVLPLTPAEWRNGQASIRGMQIGDYLYVCSSVAVGVYALDGFDQVARVVIDPDAEEDTWVEDWAVIE
jgi:uncharacterized secreted protein with C-terminal beta-propeller domain